MAIALLILIGVALVTPSHAAATYTCLGCYGPPGLSVLLGFSGTAAECAAVVCATPSATVFSRADLGPTDTVACLLGTAASGSALSSACDEACNDGGNFIVYSVGCPTPGAQGDPHFIGMDGSRYDYMGNTSRVIALISDRTTQVNSHFIGKEGLTLMGAVGVRVCDHSVQLYANNHSLLLDGKPVHNYFSPSSNTPARVALSAALSVERLSADRVRVQAGSWRMVMQVDPRHFLNLLDIEHLDKSDTHIHGALGVTGRADHHEKNKTLCQPRKEGGCELPGKWQDYELAQGADLLSTAWTYSQYDAKSCDTLVKANDLAAPALPVQQQLAVSAINNGVSSKAAVSVSKGALAGIVVGAAVGVLIVASILFVALSRH